jgi:hypothetical protein
VFADYANLHPLRMWGGLLNEVAILLFIGMTAYSVRQGLRDGRVWNSLMTVNIVKKVTGLSV